MTFQKLETHLGYVFKNNTLLEQALRHASVTSKNQQNYERLEFLGDRILGLAVADILYQAYPKDAEGLLAKRQSYLVSAETLASLGLSWGLQDFIQAENKDLAHNRPSILADAVEAILAVVYLESGFKAAHQIVHRFWEPLVQDMVTAPQDPKSALQEWAHRLKTNPPTYDLLSKTGPDHALEFTVRASLTVPQHESITTDGKGPSLRQAEKQAATALLTILENHFKSPL
jgi:ribonuclease-3